MTGYLVEKALSADNLFVFLLIFTYFDLFRQNRHKVLFWGILGALVCRAIFIAGGVVLVHRFDWLFYLFGLFLMYSAAKLLQKKEEKIEPEKALVMRALKRILPVTHDCAEGRFFVRVRGAIYATPLFLALVSIETADLIFALDSIPAILGITSDVFIIYTSNVFAILGLRSLYFALEGLIGMFRNLHYGLAAILFFIGAKMVARDILHIPVWVSLVVVVLILILAIASSFKDEEKPTN